MTVLFTFHFIFSLDYLYLTSKPFPPRPMRLLLPVAVSYQNPTFVQTTLFALVWPCSHHQSLQSSVKGLSCLGLPD